MNTAKKNESSYTEKKTEIVDLGAGFSLEISYHDHIVEGIWHPREPHEHEVPLVSDAYARLDKRIITELVARTGKKKVYRVLLIDSSGACVNRSQRRATAKQARREQ
jgi:hypothetical protein